jgi:hypothetical protein
MEIRIWQEISYHVFEIIHHGRILAMENDSSDREN